MRKNAKIFKKYKNTQGIWVWLWVFTKNQTQTQAFAWVHMSC